MYFLAVLYCVHSYYILYITYGHINQFWHIIPNSFLFVFFQDFVESTATSPPPTSPSCSSTPGTSSTTPDTPSKWRVPGGRRGMRRARQSWRNGWEDVILHHSLKSWERVCVCVCVCIFRCACVCVFLYACVCIFRCVVQCFLFK